MRNSTIPPKDISDAQLLDIRVKALTASKLGSTTNLNNDFTVGSDKNGKTVWTSSKDAEFNGDAYYVDGTKCSVFTNNSTKLISSKFYTGKDGVEYAYSDSDKNGFMDTLTVSNQKNVTYHKSNQKSDVYDLKETIDSKTLKTKTEKYNPQTGQYEVQKEKEKSFIDKAKDFFSFN